MKEAILLTDGYKLDHRRQYPENTEYVYSNWTPRSCHYYPEATEGAVVFGIQYFIKEYLMKQFQQDFFNKPKDIAVAEFKREDFENWREQVEAFKIISPIEWVGAYEVLWKIFGGTINEKGYKVLNPKVGIIYGDSITLERQKEQEDKSCLQTVFEDGKLVKEWSLSQIRANVNNSIVLED